MNLPAILSAGLQTTFEPYIHVAQAAAITLAIAAAVIAGAALLQFMMTPERDQA